MQSINNFLLYCRHRDKYSQLSMYTYLPFHCKTVAHWFIKILFYFEHLVKFHAFHIWNPSFPWTCQCKQFVVSYVVWHCASRTVGYYLRLFQGYLTAFRLILFSVMELRKNKKKQTNRKQIEKMNIFTLIVFILSIVHYMLIYKHTKRAQGINI